MKRLQPASRMLLYSLFLTLLLPDIFRLNEGIDLAYTAIRGLAGLIAVFLLFQTKSRRLVSLGLYILYMGIITMAHGIDTGKLVRFISIYADIFIISVFTEFLIRKDTYWFVRCLNVIVWIGLIINMITVFALPNGLAQITNEVNGTYQNGYFYGYDNSFIVRYLPTIVIIFIHEKCIKRKTKGGAATILAMLICFATLFYLKSVACCIAILTIIVGYFLLDLIPSKILNFKMVWLGYLFADILLLIGSNNVVFSNIIGKLEKTTSFFKRTRTWAVSVNTIKDNLFFGIGIQNTAYMRELFWYAQLHNSALTIILWGGLIGLILYTYFIFSLQEGSVLKKKSERTDLRFFSVLFIGAMVGSLFDGLELLPYIYLFYILIGNYIAIEQLESIPYKRKKISFGGSQKRIIIRRSLYEKKIDRPLA